MRSRASASLGATMMLRATRQCSPPAELRGDARGRGIAARQRGRDRRAVLLIGLRHIADAEFRNDRVLEADAAEFARNVVGRILRPDCLDGLDRLDEFARAYG